MLAAVLRMLGVDLQEQVSRLKAHVNEVAERVSDRVQEQIKETGVTLGLGLIGAVAAVSTIGIALAALFISVDRQSGPLVALGAVGGVTAALAALMFVLAAAHGKWRVPPTIQSQPASLPRATASSPPPIPRLDLSSLMSPPPHNAGLLDVVAHRLNTRVAATSDQAIDAAADFVRTGSRQALLSTLAVAVLLGVVMGRRK